MGEIGETENTKGNLDTIFKTFRGIAWVNCKYFFKDKPVNTNLEKPDFNNFKEKKSNKKIHCDILLQHTCSKTEQA